MYLPQTETRFRPRFYGVCYALLFVTGVKLAWDGVTGVFL